MGNGVVGGVLATVGAALIAVAAPAHADKTYSGPEGDHDANALWVDVTNAGVTGGSPDSVANLASTVCSKLNSGVSEGDLIAAVATDHPGSMYTAQAAIHAVEWHFCPDYY